MKLKELELLADQPIQESDAAERDGLDFNIYARILARAALGTKGPFTIGVFGEWGTGKTSLLRMIKRELDTQPEVATVWFNAWQYEQEEHPVVPLIASMLRGVQAKKGFLDKLGDGRQRFVNALRAVAYGSSFKASVGVPDLVKVQAVLSGKDLIDKAEELSSDLLLEGSIHYQAYAKLEEIDLGQDARIVVLIDDLDRCMPDQAIKLLESIKLVLSQPGFIFILGVSRRVIEGYLQHRYQEDYGIAEFRGGDYLEKIVQLAFPIPPHRGRMESFSTTLLKRRRHDYEADELEGILPLVGLACSNNPRATVRFVNNLLVDKEINLALVENRGWTKIDIGYFAITRALQHRWPRFFDLVERFPHVCAPLLYWPDDPPSGPPEDGSPDALAFSMLEDPDLQALLSSDHGTKWLEDHETRTTAIQFLETQRQEPVPARERLHGVSVRCSPDDMQEGASIVEILLSHGLDAHLQRQTSPVRSSAVVWILGAHWKIQEFPDFSTVLPLFADLPLYLVLLPEAARSSLPDKIEHELTVVIRELPIREDDLSPLIRALQRRSRQEAALDRLTVQLGDALEVDG